MLKKQSMLVCFGMLPETSTPPQVQRASINHLVPVLDRTLGFRQKQFQGFVRISSSI